MTIYVAAWLAQFPFRWLLVGQQGKRITIRWFGSGRDGRTSVDFLVPGTFGEFSVDCLHLSLDRHLRGGMRGNQAEVCAQFAFGTLEVGCGELPDVVVAGHVISRKQ